MILGEGPSETDLISINEIPITHSGRAPFQVENALAAAAAAWALGLPNEAIRTGLETFRADRQDDPCRFNVVPHGDATLVIDDCHNVSALFAVVSALDRFPSRKRTAIYSAGGARRDEDIVRQGEILAAAFDRVILYDDPSATGRARVMSPAFCEQGWLWDSEWLKSFMFLTIARQWARPWTCSNRASWRWFRSSTVTSNRVSLCCRPSAWSAKRKRHAVVPELRINPIRGPSHYQ